MVRVTTRAGRQLFLVLLSLVLPVAALSAPGAGSIAGGAMTSSTASAAVGPTPGKAQVMWTAGPGTVLPQRDGSGGLLVVVRGTGMLAGLTPTSGAALWQHTLASTFGPEGTMGPTGAIKAGVVSGGAVFVVGSLNATSGAGARVMAFSQSTGAPQWTLSSAAWFPTSVTAGGGVVAVTGDPLSAGGDLAHPRGVYALRATNGSVLWHDEPSMTEPLTGGAPIVADGLVLIPSPHIWPNSVGRYTAVGAMSGQPRWTAPDECADGTGSSWYASRATLFLSCPAGYETSDTEVFAVNASTGALRWATDTAGLRANQVVDATTSTVYVTGSSVSLEGDITTAALNAATGAVEWRTAGIEIGRDGTLFYLSQSVRPSGTATFSAGRVVDALTGVPLGSFSFAGGSVNARMSIYQGNEAVLQGWRFPTLPKVVAAVRLPTSGWMPPVVTMAATPDGGGYWIVGQDGGVFAYGDASFEGSLPGIGVHMDDIVAMAVTPDGRGYWLVGQDGGVYAFGDAGFYGSAATLPLARPIVSMAATSDGDGYWLLGADGGVFAFGDAEFSGAQPRSWAGWVAISATPGGGYRLTGFNGPTGSGATGPTTTPAGGATTGGPGGSFAVDGVGLSTGAGGWTVRPNGSVFTYGDAAIYGSLPKLGLAVDDIVGVAATPDGGGYWMLGADGGVFSFGDAQFYGSRG